MTKRERTQRMYSATYIWHPSLGGTKARQVFPRSVSRQKPRREGVYLGLFGADRPRAPRAGNFRDLNPRFQVTPPVALCGLAHPGNHGLRFRSGFSEIVPKD